MGKVREGIQNCQSCGEPFLLDQGATTDRPSCPYCGAAVIQGPSVVRAWKTALWISFVATFISYKLEQAGWFLGLIPILVAIGFEWRLVYKLWELVPSQSRTISPLRAYGFLMIPFFNFYWAFRMFRSLGRVSGGRRLVVGGTVVASVFVLICLSAFIPVPENGASAALDLFLTVLWAGTAYVFYAVVLTRLSTVSAADFLPAFSKGRSFQLEK